MSPTHHHQQQRRNSVNTNSDSSEDGPWQCSTPLVRIFFFYQIQRKFSKILKCTEGTVNDVPGKYPLERSCFPGILLHKERPFKVVHIFLRHY